MKAELASHINNTKKVDSPSTNKKKKSPDIMRKSAHFINMLGIGTLDSWCWTVISRGVPNTNERKKDKSKYL